MYQLTDATGLVTRYTYDGQGRILTQTVVTSEFPAGVTTTRTYDARGNVLTELGPVTPQARSARPTNARVSAPTTSTTTC